MEELARFGATVHTCSRNQEELESCLDDWKSNGLVVTGSVCDASVRDQREKLIQEVSSAFSGKLNILVSFFFHTSLITKSSIALAYKFLIRQNNH